MTSRMSVPSTLLQSLGGCFPCLLTSPAPIKLETSQPEESRRRCRLLSVKAAIDRDRVTRWLHGIRDMMIPSGLRSDRSFQAPSTYTSARLGGHRSAKSVRRATTLGMSFSNLSSTSLVSVSSSSMSKQCRKLKRRRSERDDPIFEPKLRPIPSSESLNSFEV